MIQDWMERGGPAMWPLLAMSIWCLGVGFERAWYWAFVARRGPDWNVAGPEALNIRLQRLLLGEQRRCLRGLGGIEAIAVMSPMVGILGTVLGIIEAFDAVSTSEGSDPLRVSGGVSEALITTAYGLIVALFALGCRHLFGSLAEARLEELELEARSRLALSSAMAPAQP